MIEPEEEIASRRSATAGIGQDPVIDPRGLEALSDAAAPLTPKDYSPPIRAIGHYEIDEGELRRRPASPDEPSAPSPRLLSAISAQPRV